MQAFIHSLLSLGETLLGLLCNDRHKEPQKNSDGPFRAHIIQLIAEYLEVMAISRDSDGMKTGHPMVLRATLEKNVFAPGMRLSGQQAVFHV